MLPAQINQPQWQRTKNQTKLFVPALQTKGTERKTRVMRQTTQSRRGLLLGSGPVPHGMLQRHGTENERRMN
jgi:hypothetical protein